MSCKFCNGYYGSSYGQPVCSTCHSFIYDYSTDENGIAMVTEEKDASGDSGNEEPEKASDFYVSKLPCSVPCSSDDDAAAVPALAAANKKPSPVSGPALSSRVLTPYQVRMPQGVSNYIEHLPTEILLLMFDYLDDISLWALREVSLRFKHIIDSEIPESKWLEFVKFRWPLFKAYVEVTSWLEIYSNLVKSSACRYCLERMHSPVLFRIEAHSWRYRRIASEMKSLCRDPPYGICAVPLDCDTYSHCQATICGPPGSPYEGGLFFIFVLVPYSYPMRPPVIRFLTKIFHPNISLHGDVGLDCILYNWSLALTLGKVLISVQSLLTDPYTHVCMEPGIGLLFNENRPEFERIARRWTWKYAMHDFFPSSYVRQLKVTNFPQS